MITGIKKISIDVSDLPEALGFFVEKLNLPILRETESRVYPSRWEMGFSTSGPTMAIVKQKATEPPVTPGRITIVFETDNVEADYGALQAKGVAFIAPPTLEPLEEGKVAYFEGPDGIALSLFEPSQEQ